jgi:hypothetical protein
MATAKKARKVSPEMKAATDAVKNAKSDQEKTVARGALKRLRFKVLIVQRMNKALSALGNTAKLGNRASYLYDQAQIDKVFAALDKKVSAFKSSFNVSAESKSGKVQEFDL